ncbi:MAG: chromosomal replication initiator protein DnaA [Solirubrobacteraceae bacterium]|nr:chromosomal replication initiator protein DnaA [Solirubrobacteraceae bacterium]
MTSDPFTTIWERIRTDLREAVGPSMFEIWLAPLRLAALEGDELVVEAPAETRAWIADRFGRILQASAAAVLGEGVTVHVAGADLDAAAPRQRGAADGSGPPPASAAPPEAGLNPRFTFDQFVIGTTNRFAHGAALAVAENPGTAYNPLVLCGPPGVGKTHLLHAIGTYLERYDASVRVRLTTAEAFANDFIAAVRGRGMEAFKSRYRDTDVLLVDDVQFLMAKARTEEEFFHTFNAVRDAGAQVVVTSDRAPRDLDGLEDRLRDRFEAGLVASITRPDRATRIAALRKRALLDQLDLDDDVLETIASRVTTNLRALEGALIRVVAFASLSGRAVDAALAEEVLAELAPAPSAEPGTAAGRPSIEDVQRLACEAFGLTRDELVSPSRASRLAWPRQLAMYLAREHTGASLPVIGEQFGGRGHTTVLHACRRAATRLAGDPEASQLVNELSTRLSTREGSGRGDRPD